MHRNGDFCLDVGLAEQRRSIWAESRSLLFVDVWWGEVIHLKQAQFLQASGIS